MSQPVGVGSAEFQLLMNLPAFREAVEKQAPEIAKSGAQKVARELEAGAKAGANAQIREAKRAADAIIAEAERSVRGSQGDTRSLTQAVRASTLPGRTFTGAVGGPSGVVNEQQRAAQAMKQAEQAARANEAAINKARTSYLLFAAAVAGAGVALGQYGEYVQDTVKLQDELNTLTGQSSDQLQDFRELSGAFDGLAKAGSSLANTIAVAIAPEVTHLVNLLARGAKVADDFIRAIGGDRVSRQADAVNALQAANSEVNKEERKRAAETAKEVAEAAKEKAQAQIGYLEDTKKRVTEQANDEKQRINDVRDAKLKASEDQERAALRALDNEHEAASDLIKNQIDNAELARDRKIAAVEKAKDAALRAFEAEDRAREDQRRLEDRQIEASTEAQRRAIDKRHTEQMRAFDRERSAIEDRRDAALRAIDDERDAEDRRHSEVMDNLQREQDERLGIIDEQLRALSDQERAESRAERAQSLRQALGEAKGDLKQAQRSGDPEAIRRARQGVARAENDIRREERNNQREDLRRSLEDQKESIRQEIDARKDAELQKTDAVKTGLDDRAQAVQDNARKQLDELATHRQQAADANALELQDFQDHLAKQNQARQDARIEEDRINADRKKAISDNAIAEVESIKAAYDDPVNGIIPALQRQELEINRSFERRKLAISDHARDEQTKIRETADYQSRALDIMTNNVFRALEQQKVYWTNYANYAQAEAKRATNAVNAPQVPHTQQQYQQQQYSTNYGQQAANAINIAAGIGQNPIQVAINALKGPTLQEFLNGLGGGNADGGIVNEPTLLMGLKSGRLGSMAERGPDRIVPAGGLAGLGGVTLNMPITVNGAQITNDSALADMIAIKAAEHFAMTLDKVQRFTRQRASSTLPGAM